jgi:hypothetical protein
VKGQVSHLYENLLEVKELLRDTVKTVTVKQNCCLCQIRNFKGYENAASGFTQYDVVYSYMYSRTRL